MEKAKEFLQLTQEESESVSRLTIHPHKFGVECGFYDDFALRGIQVDQVEPGFVSCTFKVPPRLTDRNGNLATGAIANLIDVVGASVVHVEGLPMNGGAVVPVKGFSMNVSVDLSISFLSTAKVDDELEIASRVLGQRGGYKGILVVVKNKATGEIIAEGRLSMLGIHVSKM